MTIHERTMRVKDAWEHYYAHSGSASDRVRQLGFAGIALIWLLAFGGEATAPLEEIPQDLLLPGLLIVAALGCDLLQYLYAASAWGIFANYKENAIEKGKHPNEPFDAPDWINYPTLAFWVLKAVGVGVAYVFLGLAVVKRMGLI